MGKKNKGQKKTVDQAGTSKEQENEINKNEPEICHGANGQSDNDDGFSVVQSKRGTKSKALIPESATKKSLQSLPKNSNLGAVTKKFAASNLSCPGNNQPSLIKLGARDEALPVTNGSEQGFELAIPQRKTQSGVEGRPIKIETNHLALSFKNLKRAVHYDVSITPNTPKHLFRKVMENFRQQCYKDRYPAFDGTKNLYSSSDLPFDKEIFSEVTVTEKDHTRTFKVIVKFANYVDMTPLEKFVTATANGNYHMTTPQEVLQCLDIVLRSAPALTFTQVGRSYFTKPKDQLLNIGGGMEVYYGFYQSAIIGWKPYLNIDVAHKAFAKSQNLIKVIEELCNLNASQLQKNLEKKNEITVSRFLATTIKIEYQIPNKPSSKREYRVNGLEKAADELMFVSDGKKMTVNDYFYKVKRVTLKYPKMPCVWVGNKKRETRIFLPAELCTIVESQVINKKLPEQFETKMIKQTASSTKVRKDKIIDSIGTANFNQNSCIREFGITVDDKFAQIDARVLDSPSLNYNGTTTVKPVQGVWKPHKFYTPVTLSQWTVVNMDRYTRMEQIEDFVKSIISQSANVGMKISLPQRPFLALTPRYKREVEDIAELFEKIKNLQLCFVIIPSNGLYYGHVKQAAELRVGCLTQCVKSKTVTKMSSMVINILQKVNAKLEGTNHIIGDRLEWMRRPYMIMGADVTHPSPDAKDKTSIAAVTASHDCAAFKYNMCYRFQPPNVEIIEDLEEITREHLLYFYKATNQVKPERIVFFRDGVSEGQFQHVSNIEIQAIRRACMRLQADGMYKPKITFLVVQKRHHTRFFPTNERDALRDKNLNVPVGTCVDTDITHPTALDFCLVSHASIQGVARPTKYRVLWDDSDFTEDELEQMSFYFCHMFARCSRSLSYPAPTYYAHLAAARITAYTEGTKLNLTNLTAEQERLTVKPSILKDHPMFFV